MSITKPIVQRFLKGLNTTLDLFSLPEGALRDLQQLLFSFLSGLTTCDAVVELTSSGGASTVVIPDGTHPANQAILAFAEYYPASAATSSLLCYLTRVSANAAIFVAVPSGLVATGVNVGGGILIPGTTYTYDITAIDNDSTLGYGVAGETTAAVITKDPGMGNNAVTITWNIDPGAAGYRIYGRIGGAIGLLATVDANTLSFTDTGNTAPGAQTPPLSNTTNLVVALDNALSDSVGLGFSTLLPFCPIQAVATFSSVPGVIIVFFTASGGIKGLTGPVPQMVMCPNNLMVLCLGNGIFPYAITSNAGSGFIPVLLGSTTITPPPAGQHVPVAIAHGLFHAGIFWAANTWVTNHANGLDGPSALRQSNVNDPTTYNTTNSTFVSKNDGDEITAIAAFSIAEAGIAPAGNVVIYKNKTTWLASPNLISSTAFTLTQAQTDMGCVAPRSVRYVAPLGQFRLTHKGLALFDGLRDTLLTDSSVQSIFDNRDNAAKNLDWNFAYLSKGFYVDDPSMYGLLYPKIGGEGATGRMSGLLLYDIRNQAFTTANLLSAGLNAGGHYSSVYSFNPPGGKVILLLASSDVGKIYKWQTGAATDPNGNQVSWTFTTAEVFNFERPSDPLFIDSLIIKGSGSGSITSVTANINGSASSITLLSSQVPDQNYAGAGTDWQVDVKVNQTVMNMNVTISGTGPVNIHLIKWEIVDKPAVHYVLC